MPEDPFFVFGGLPVYTSKYFPGEAFVMAHRPYSKLTGAELAQALSDQLRPDPARQVETTTFGDASRTFLTGPAASSTFTTLEQSPLWSGSAISSTANVETVFRVGPDGRPEAVTRLVDHPMPSSVRNAGEADLAWLKRRVNEICWRPS